MTGKARRTTLRSRSGKKLYAVRDKSGKFKDIQTYERAHRADLKKKSAAEKDAAARPARKAAKKAAGKAGAVAKKAVRKAASAVRKVARKVASAAKKTVRKATGKRAKKAVRKSPRGTGR